VTGSCHGRWRSVAVSGGRWRSRGRSGGGRRRRAPTGVAESRRQRARGEAVASRSPPCEKCQSPPPRADRTRRLWPLALATGTDEKARREDRWAKVAPPSRGQVRVGLNAWRRCHVAPLLRGAVATWRRCYVAPLLGGAVAGIFAACRAGSCTLGSGPARRDNSADARGPWHVMHVGHARDATVRLSRVECHVMQVIRVLRAARTNRPRPAPERSSVPGAAGREPRNASPAGPAAPRSRPAERDNSARAHGPWRVRRVGHARVVTVWVDIVGCRVMQVAASRDAEHRRGSHPPAKIRGLAPARPPPAVGRPASRAREAPTRRLSR
jgi:hypothetical protein